MLITYATGVAILLLVFVGWVIVQTAWRQVFFDHGGDPDVLVGRMGCHDCGCKVPCKRKNFDAPEEGIQ